MSQFKKFLIILAVSSVILVAIAVVWVNLVKTKHYYPKTRSFEKEEFFGTDKVQNVIGLSNNTKDFYYVSCDTKTNTTHHLCNVTVETPDASDVIFKQTCNISVSNDFDKGYDVLDKFLQPLDNKSVLLRLDRVKHSKSVESTIYIVKMDNCTVAKVSLTGLHYAPGIYLRTEAFDVFYTNVTKDNATHPDCHDHFCRISYNLDGKLIYGPKKFMKRPSFGQHKVGHWAPLLLNDSVNTNSIFFKIDFEVPLANGLYWYRSRIANKLFMNNSTFSGLSFSNQKISACINYKNNNASCAQYDSEAKLQVNFNLNLSNFSNHTNDVKVIPHNLQSGELIVVLIEFVDPKLNEKIDNFRIFNIRNSSQHTLPKKILYKKMNSTSSDILTYNFVEDDAEVCFKVMTTNLWYFNHHNYVKYRIECIPKRLF